MQFLRFVVALFFISIHGAIAAALNSQGCPQDLCYEGVCQVGGVGCPGNAKCMDVGTPGQLGCCAPCGIVHTGPHGMPTGWTTSIVSTHPVPTFPRSIKSIPIPTDRSTSADATITLTNVPSIVTAGPSSFLKSIQSLLTDRSTSTPAPAHTYTYGGGGGSDGCSTGL
ncbi:hypothetical protein V8F06_005214 [Rhypophila decipiens]